MLRRTKFFRPPSPQDLVIRPRLNDQIGQGLRLRPLTLVSAPAGYGKTLLVSSFLQSCPLPSVWLSLDDGDNDMRVFLDYLLTALDTLFPGSLARTQLFLAGESLPPLAVIADSLLNELAALDRAFVVALDDLHVISAADIHGLLAALLRYPLPGLHLMLLTRQDPPLGLGALRARGQVAEIRARDLRFTLAETAAFMGHAAATGLPAAALASLAERTEGWAAGLRLAALTLRYGGEIDSQAAALHAENRYVMDYLMGEVLAHVPPALEDFLVKTALFDTLCGPLCDAVVEADAGEHRGQAYLRMLEATNMFTIALDEQGIWYRYHHLFQGLLRSRLSHKFDGPAIDALHCRASVWYASHDFLEAALEHALAGHNLPMAQQLVAQHRHHLLNTEQRPRLTRWLHLFPPDAVVQFPDLLLAMAWCTMPGRVNARTSMAYVDRAQLLIEQMSGEPARARQLRGEVDALRVVEKSFAAADPHDVILLATCALAAMPQAWYMVRSLTWVHLAVAYQMSGQPERAHAALAVGQQEDTLAADLPRMRVAGSVIFIYWLAADLPNLVQMCQTVVSVGQATARHDSLGWGHCFLASACYHWNDLATAELHANAVQAQRYACDPIAVAQSAFVVAAVQQERGQFDEQRRTLDRLTDFLTELRCDALLPVVLAFDAELAVRRGDLATAARWAATAGPLFPLSLMAFFYAPQLTLPRVLLAMNTPASRQQAAAALARLHAFVTTTHNTRFTIEVLALQALHHAAEGDEAAACAALAEAVTLAQPGGLIRVFVDLGPAMLHLLRRLAQHSDHASYIQQILAAFPAPAGDAVPHSPALRPLAGPADLVEPLSGRELEVLALLAQRLSAREIAQCLAITERTVNRHSANIYEKLAVNNWHSAVAVATDLGLLPAPP